MAALVARDFAISRTYRAAVALEFLFGLLNLIVFFFVADLVGAGRAELPVEADYFDFAAVGIAIAVVVEAGMTGIAVRLREEQLTGTLEELATQPLSASSLAVGLGALPLMLASVRVVVYLFVGWLVLGLDLGRADWLGAVIVFFTIALTMFAIGAAVAAVTFVVKRSQVIVGITAFAIAILGGAFFPIAVLPESLEAVARALPTSQIFSGARAALLVGHGWEDAAAKLAIFGAVMVPIGLAAFTASLRRSRRNGTLSEY
jgi:ABC-2 type transport system permease protein